MNMTSTPDDDYTDGFAGPAVGKVDFTPIGEEGMYAEMRDLQSRIVNYIDQRGSAAPASDKDTAALIVKNLVKFHHESDVWIDHVGKTFVKAQLIGRWSCRTSTFTLDSYGIQIVSAISSPIGWNSAKGSMTRRNACCTRKRNRCPLTSSSLVPF